MVEIEGVIAGVSRAALYGIPLVAGWRVMRQFTWPIGVACSLGIILGIAAATGQTTTARVASVLLAAVNAYIYIDRMRNDPMTLRRLLASKEAEWSEERHELINDRAALKAQLWVERRDS